MSMKSLFCLEFVLYIVHTVGQLDFEELQGINYGIDILEKPAIAGIQDPGMSSMHLTSKFGQKYQCSYHDRRQDEQKEQEEEKNAMETGIPDLLKTMEDRPCLIHTKGWWSYEFCYKRDIRQYHMEDGQPTGNIMYLGYYESETDWGNYTKPKTSGRSKKIGGDTKVYHSQLYRNGTLCDLTNHPRRTDVRFTCKEGQKDLLFSVDEPETCAYIFHVQTALVCSHPYLKPPAPSHPVSITCQPLLSEEEYDDYMRHEREREQAKQEAIAKAKEREAAKRAEKEMYGDGSTDGESDSTEGNLQDVFMESILQGLQAALGQDTQVSDVKMKMKYIDKATDISKAVQELLRTEQLKGKKDSTKDEQEDDDGDNEDADDGDDLEFIEEDDLEKGSRSETGHKVTEQLMPGKQDSESTSQSETQRIGSEKHVVEDDSTEEDGETEVELEEEEEDSEDQDLMKEFDNELDKIASSPKEREQLSKYKDNIESAMHAQFGEILDEAQQELQGEDGEGGIDKGVAFKQLAKTLDSLLKRLDQTEKEMKSVDDLIKEKEKQLEEETRSLEDEDSDDGGDDDDNIFHISGKPKGTTSRITYKDILKSKSHKYQKHFNHPSDHVNKFKDIPRGKHGSLPPIRRKTLLDRKSFHRDTDSTSSLNSKQASIKDEGTHTQKVTEVLKSKLQQVGMETTGRKVEVKILTEFLDESELEKYKDADGKPVDRIVFAVVTENDGEVEEQQHHHQMEKAYNFAWGDSAKKKRKHVHSSLLP